MGKYVRLCGKIEIATTYSGAELQAGTVTKQMILGQPGTPAVPDWLLHGKSMSAS